MNVLIVYGTTEGQTRKIVHFIRDRIGAPRAGGARHDVVLIEAIDASTDVDPSAFDATIVAASLHAGRYQSAIEHYARAYATTLATVRAAFVSVSLSAAGTDEEETKGLERCVDDFAHRTGWRPAVLLHVAGAFRYTQYDFFKRLALKYIAWRKGAPTDTGQDYELTDWDEVARFVDTVLLAQPVAGAA